MAEKQNDSEEFIKNEKTVTEYDAIHPRFMNPQDPEEIYQYQLKNHYFCDQCQLFFAPTVRGLQTHFREDMVQHRPYGSCFYCRGDVFYYKLYNKLYMYHNCKDDDDGQEQEQGREQERSGNDQ